MAESADKYSPRKRHRGRWGLLFGVPGAMVVAVAVAASVFLIAPGVSAAGTEVGWRTPGAAAEAISENLAGTDITITSGDNDVTLSGADLGLSVDADAVAEKAHSDSPLWNVTAWNSGSLAVPIEVDTQKALASLRTADPDVFTKPQDADVSFDDDAGEFTAVAGEDGVGIDAKALSASVSSALSAQSADISVDVPFTDIAPQITTATAKKQAKSLNAMINDTGFSVDGNTVVSVDPSDAASWLDVTRTDDGFEVSADEEAIQKVVKSLPDQVDRDALDSRVVTNSKGKTLHTVREGHDGWTLDSTDGIAEAFAKQLASGDGVYELTVDVDKAKTEKLFRKVEVDKSEGKVMMYENDKLVNTFPVAIGKDATPTHNGHFTVNAQLRTQDMGCVPGYDYCTEDVPWISYFNGDQAFHGTYWHDNFGKGSKMSHGCVNMRIDDAKKMFHFAQIGTEVWVHD